VIGAALANVNAFACMSEDKKARDICLGARVKWAQYGKAVLIALRSPPLFESTKK